MHFQNTLYMAIVDSPSSYKTQRIHTTPIDSVGQGWGSSPSTPAQRRHFIQCRIAYAISMFNVHSARFTRGWSAPCRQEQRYKQ